MYASKRYHQFLCELYSLLQPSLCDVNAITSPKCNLYQCLLRQRCRCSLAVTCSYFMHYHLLQWISEKIKLSFMWNVVQFVYLNSAAKILPWKIMMYFIFTIGNGCKNEFTLCLLAQNVKSFINFVALYAGSTIA